MDLAFSPALHGRSCILKIRTFKVRNNLGLPPVNTVNGLGELKSPQGIEMFCTSPGIPPGMANHSGLTLDRGVRCAVVPEGAAWREPALENPAAGRVLLEEPHNVHRAHIVRHIHDCQTRAHAYGIRVPIRIICSQRDMFLQSNQLLYIPSALGGC